MLETSDIDLFRTSYNYKATGISDWDAAMILSLIEN